MSAARDIWKFVREEMLFVLQCGGKGHYENECQSRSEEDEEGPTQTRIAFHPVQPSRGGSHLDKGKEIVLG